MAASIGVLALLGSGLVGRGEDPTPAGTRVNDRGTQVALRERPAPPFTLRLLGGGAYRLGQEPRAVTLVNFWASWCAPCRQEAPVLEELHHRYRDRGLTVVGFDLWDTPDDARRFVAQVGLDFPTGPGEPQAAAVDYGVRGIPETYVVDADGLLVRRWIGPLDEQQATDLLRGVLR